MSKIIAITAGICLCWAVGAFISTQWNPFDWAPGDRALLIMLGVGLGSMLWLMWSEE
jgi:hypothetical protein